MISSGQHGSRGAIFARDEIKMKTNTAATPLSMPSTIDEYIAVAAKDVQPILEKIRKTVRKAAPDAEEIISYRMPALTQGGILIYFAAFKSHIGIYPPFSGDPALEAALSPYAGPKRNLKFPLDQPIPYDLITRIVQRRLDQKEAKSKSRRK